MSPDDPNPHALYRRPVALDPARHPRHRVAPPTDWRFASGQHAAFLTVAEIPHTVGEYAVVFVRNDAGAIQPVALLGLEAGENLHVDADTGRWKGRYIPASFRRYPFITGAVPAGQNVPVLVDEAWPGFGTETGELLFEPVTTPGVLPAQAPALQRAIAFLQRFDEEVQRTIAFCARLAELDLLEPMKIDATLPGERKLRVDGFEIVDEKKLLALPDATVLELFRNGMLGMLQLHLASVGHIHGLVDRKGEREADALRAKAGPASAPSAAAGAPA